ncbi:Aste57867_10577 [Aphanomyces stellatus]|uniref:Amino acid transporter n=1 Tax=Aphanomyces stellatus TaxID=120398 RepID=A0A485KQU2_9STRA|nr:hypothetical protein As57867_010537 [Aphanomyces stellatus]VFT87450.1 Aste57867_10577 [Aphanomyces stellatus]
MHNPYPGEPKPARPGVLLFDGSPTVYRGSFTTTPSSKVSSSARNIPHDAGNVRTNFMSNGRNGQPTPPAPFTIPQPYSSVNVPYDSYLESPTAMLPPDQPTKGLKPPAHDQDFPAPHFHAMYVVLGAVIGVAVGLGVYYAKIGPEWQKVVALPGDLFVRALRCLIVPLVLCIMTIVVAEAVALGRSSLLRWRTLVPYITSSTLATLQGFGLALVFKTYFARSVGTAAAAAAGDTYDLVLTCNGNTSTLMALANGSVACLPSTTANATAFFHAVHQAAATTSAAASTVAKISLMDQVVAIANLIVPANIFASLVNGDLLSIVMFSIPLGFAAAHSVHDGHDNLFLTFLKQVRDIFIVLLNGLLRVTPVAVVFLMGGSIARLNTNELSDVMSQVGYYIMAFHIGAVSHAFVCLPLLMFVWVRVNPYAYIQRLVPAYVFAFGCASSMATLPVAIECIQRAKVSRSLAHITMPFGTPVNMNAAGIYYPLAVVFMATMDGRTLSTINLVVLFFVSLLGCMSTAPLPSAALVYCITLWSTIFPGVPLPSSFPLVMTADVLLDRVSTMLNVNGNAIVTRILAEQIDETFEVRAAQLG